MPKNTNAPARFPYRATTHSFGHRGGSIIKRNLQPTFVLTAQSNDGASKKLYLPSAFQCRSMKTLEPLAKCPNLYITLHLG